MTLTRRISIIVIALVIGGPAGARASDLSGALTLRVNVSHRLGKIRPLQGLVGGPLCQRGAVDLTRYYRELGVPDVRLHDVPWMYDDVLDVNYVFPKWSAPANDTKSYNFVGTDYYMRTVEALHTNIIFRIGYSAEFPVQSGQSDQHSGSQSVQVRHNSPPVPLEKFVAIATHIVRHYNEGWDDGQKAGIKYWEIWNEPDIQNFWTGTPRQYDRLYARTARALKAMDPSLRVGGPVLAGHYDFLEQFLRYCQLHHVPVDFVSWHLYARDPNAVVQNAEKVHELMQRYGFSKSESILDEWNFGWTNWNALFSDAEATREYFDSTYAGQGAAFDAAVLSKLQDAPVDRATFYTGTTEMWGLFTSSGSPQKPYYAFLAFRRLLDTPTRVAVDGLTQEDAALSVLAGVSNDGQTIRVLLSNTSPDARLIKLEFDHDSLRGTVRYTQQIVDDHHSLDAVTRDASMVAPRIEVDLSGHSVQLITLKGSPQ